MDCMNGMRASHLGVRKLACALSWALETKRWQATRTPRIFFGVRKLACALSWLAQTKPCPIFSSTACKDHYGNSGHAVARKGLTLVPSLEQKTMSLNSDPLIDMGLSKVMFEKASSSDPCLWTRAKPAQVFRCVTGSRGVE